MGENNYKKSSWIEVLQTKLLYQKLIKIIESRGGADNIKILDSCSELKIFLDLTKDKNWFIICLDTYLNIINKKLVVGDIEKMPFKNDSFDFILNKSSFSPLKPKKALNEIIRTLKPSGTFLILDLKKQNIFFKKILLIIDFLFISKFHKRKETVEILNKAYSVKEIINLMESFKNISYNIKSCFGIYYLIIGEKLE